MTDPDVIRDEAAWIVDRIRATPVEGRWSALVQLVGCRTVAVQRAVFGLLAWRDAPVFLSEATCAAIAATVEGTKS